MRIETELKLLPSKTIRKIKQIIKILKLCNNKLRILQNSVRLKLTFEFSNDKKISFYYKTSKIEDKTYLNQAKTKNWKT